MSIIDFWILPLLCIKKAVTLVASGGVLVETGQRDQIVATFWCNSTKSYRIDSCNKSIATGQILYLNFRETGHKTC